MSEPTEPTTTPEPNEPGVNSTLPEDDRFDPWHWLAIGVERDGTTGGEREWQLDEYDPGSGAHRRFLSVTAHAGRVTRIVLLPQYPERYPDLKPVVLIVPENAHPVFFRRRSVVAILDPSAPIPEPQPRVTALGWRYVRGTKEHLLLLYDDGSVLLTDDRNTGAVYSA